MPDDEPREAFRSDLDDLLRDAAEAGVDVEGAWRCSREDGADWEVLVTAVADDDAQ